MKNKKLDLWVLFYTLAVLILTGLFIDIIRQVNETEAELQRVKQEAEAVRMDLEEFRKTEAREVEELRQSLEDLQISVEDLEALEEQTDGNVGRIFYLLRKWQREKTQEEEKKQEEAQQATRQVKRARNSSYAATAPSYDNAQAEAAPEGASYLGNYELTAYEWTGNPCANGNYPTEGLTIASNTLPIGTRVYIEGIGERTVEDTGGMPGNVIDIYMGDPGTCVQFGRQNAEVYILED